MRKNHFFITESDRLNILSMYNLITEDVKTITFNGKVSTEDNEPASFVKVYIKDDANKTISATASDEEGNFKLTANLDSEKKYFVNVVSTGYLEYKEEITNKINTEQTLNILLKISKADTELGEVTIGLVRLTNIEINVIDENNNPINDYNLNIDLGDKKNYVKNISTGKIDLNILKNGLVLEEMESGKEYEYGENGSIFSFNKSDDADVKISIKKDGYIESKKKYNIKLGNAGVKLPLINKGNVEYVKKEDPKDDEGNITNIKVNKSPSNINQINIVLKKTPEQKITFNVSDQNKKSVSDGTIKVEVDGDVIGTYTTDESGEINIPLTKDLIGKIIYVTFEKNGFKRSIKKYEIKNDKNSFKLNVINSSYGEYVQTGELNDTLKDTGNTIYGRGRTDLSQEEAYKLAKIDIVNKYIQKHKKRYKDFPTFNNQDIDLDYEFVYKRPLKGIDQHFIILKSSSKQIKKFLESYGKKENIKVTPKTGDYNEITLREALEDSFYYGKDVLVVFGLDDDENTEKVLNYLFKQMYDYYDKYYTLVFVKNSKNQSRNELETIISKNRENLSSYPRVIKLKRPTTMEQINNLDITILNNQRGSDYFK